MTASIVYRFRTVAVALLVGAVAGASAICHAQQSAATSPFEPEIAAFEKKDAVSPPPAGSIVFIGSSSIRMWSNLERAFPGKTVINRGFGGSVISDSTRFADRILLPYHPKIVVLYAGDNDLAAGKSPQQVFNDFKAFADKVRQGLPDAKLEFISIKPSPSRWKLADKMVDANSLISAYIHKQKHMAYINVFNAMLDSDGKPRPELYKEDGLHPTPVCYELWQKIIAPYLR